MHKNWQAYRENSQLTPAGISFKAISESNTTNKKFSDTDMAFLGELYASTRWEEVLQTPWSDQQRRDFLHTQFNAQHKHYLTHYPHSDYLLIIKNSEKIGRIYVDRDDSSICLIDISLLPQYRGKGIGTLLIKELILEAQNTQKKIVLHVESFNPAFQLYKKLDFVLVEDKGVHQYMEWYPKNI